MYVDVGMPLDAVNLNRYFCLFVGGTVPTEATGWDAGRALVSRASRTMRAEPKSVIIARLDELARMLSLGKIDISIRNVIRIRLTDFRSPWQMGGWRV